MHPQGYVRLSLLDVLYCCLRPLASEAVTGPGSRDPRSLDWSGGALPVKSRFYQAILGLKSVNSRG
jgi:hypothetical protein